ncbi:AsmA family protein [Methylocystis echinoides]|uniref:Cell envelope biogenesis protein AsmA n=1 Tax=Methylocystis echinoides TaxID=29468 RepID=A0A9W6GVN4_9HYPH|nr:AsmA family protein [Methylocystis echinoides]GLI93705.1 cell envelope biogenesis protein AsmA [Methylocystis echinoides]
MSRAAENDPAEAPSRPSSGAARRRVRPSGRMLLLVVALMLLGAVGGVAAALAPWLFSPAAALTAVTTQFNEATGLYLVAQSGPRLSLTPRPHLVMSGVVFGDPNKTLLVEADELRGDLRLAALLAGRLEMDSLTLQRPRARLDLDRERIGSPGAAARAAAAQSGSVAAQKADAYRLGVVTIVDGALEVRRNGADHIVEKIAATLDWRKIGEHALLTSAFDWRGQRLQLVLWVARPGIFLRGDPTVATARIDGESLRLEAQGVAQTGANPRYAGRVAGSAASVRDALGLFGIEPALPGPFGDAEIVAQAAIGPHDAAFRDLRIEVDGNVFEGEISARVEEGRPYVSAALHSDFVALKPMFFDAPPLVVDGQWSQKPLDPPDLSGADLDLTITARHARLGRLTLDDATMAAKLRDGALDLSLLEARAYRGQLKARGSFAATGGALSMHASAQTTGVDARALLSDGFGKEALGGALDSTVSLDARGETVADMLRGLNGRLTLNLSDGEIDGVDFDRALRRFEKRPLASAQDIRSGSSALIRGSANVIIENGVGALEDGAAQGPGFALAFAGTANFIERSLALKAAAREADPAGKARENGLQIAVDVAGPWDELKIAPDPKAFIRRSGAAAPLLPEAPR